METKENGITRSSLLSNLKFEIDPENFSIEMLKSGIKKVVIKRKGRVTIVNGLISSGMSQNKIRKVMVGMSSG
ncbi:hypothetical protein [Reichenbachiella faecimaris]|uniref:hypothetical protein n=1 Tax=Reichenbachiella faecimaris TaxID=692418 RepID=UPI0009FE9BC5|nr:hypothetical protein [Reichenbachiella faecimaris]